MQLLPCLPDYGSALRILPLDFRRNISNSRAADRQATADDFPIDLFQVDVN